MRRDGYYHLSDFERWRGCDKRYELEVLRGEKPSHRIPQALLGTAIHYMLERLHAKEELAAEDSELAELYVEGFSYAITNPVNPAEADAPIRWGDYIDEDGARAFFASEALAMVGGYIRDPRNVSAKLVKGHTSWECPIAGATWRGEFDGVRQEEDGSLTVIDYKSGKERPEGAALALWAQTGYAIAANRCFGLNVARVRRVHLRDYVPYQRSGKTKKGSYKAGDLRGPAYYDVDVTDTSLLVLEEEMATFVQAVEAGRFPRRPSTFECNRCRVKEVCLRSYRGAIDLSEVELSEEEYNGEG